MQYISDDEIAIKIWECINKKEVVAPILARTIDNSKHRNTKHLTALKESISKMQPFIVADIET